MLRKTLLTASCLFGLTAFAASGQEAPLLANVFGDNMVVQRGEPVAFWGTAEPKEKLTVSFAGKTKKITAGSDGAWRAEFPALTEPGPYSLSVLGSSGEGARLLNVAAGDVWLCSGQSNMEFPVSRSLNGSAHISAAGDPDIRLLKVPMVNSPVPMANFEADVAPAWQPSAPDSVGNFSAICYFFAKAIQREVDVPLGLIDSSWGGSQIEAWMSNASLRSTGLVDEKLDMLDDYAVDPQKGILTLSKEYEAWWNDNQPEADQSVWLADAGTIGSWNEGPAEMKSWTDWGDETMKTYKGTVVFGNTFTLPADKAGKPATLSLGGIDEHDVVWINGHFINISFGWGTPRTYDVPEGVLREGENTIVVNVYNSWGAGGMTGPNDAVAVRFEDGSKTPLGEGWTWRAVDAGSPPRAPWESVAGLTGIYNGMIAPLGDMKMKGTLWYQGESDAGEPETYAEYLDTMIEDWRGHFGSDMTFIAIQLANYGKLQQGPVESGWAGVRDAQRTVTAADPHAGSVVTIDTGNPRDIHPADKLTVGERAAKLAMKITYGKGGVNTGPAPAAATVEDGAVKITFAGLEGGLMSVSGAPVAFELCEAGSCRMAEAAIEGDSVILSGAGDADHVRYCWADAPVCNLYDSASQPATPFEIPVEE